MNHTKQDDPTPRRLECHEAIASVLDARPELTNEDALAVLSSCALAILSQLPPSAYAQFLADFAKMRQEGMRRIEEAKRSGALTIAPR